MTARTFRVGCHYRVTFRMRRHTASYVGNNLWALPGAIATTDTISDIGPECPPPAQPIAVAWTCDPFAGAAVNVTPSEGAV